MNEEVKVVWGNYIFDHGYFNVSNLLLDSQEELGITDDELLFIIKIQRFSNGWTISDSRLSKTLCSKSLQRRRKTLKEKGYLETIERKEKDELGQIRTYGIIYNFSGLDRKLREISERKLEVNTAKKISAERTNLSKNKTEVSALHKTINIKTTTRAVEEREELKKKIIENFKHQISIFKENPDYEFWKREVSWPMVKYKPSFQDMKNLDSLDTEDLQILSKSSSVLSEYIIFEMNSNRFRGRDGYFTPTLSLFAKARTQFNNLNKFYIESLE